MNSITIYGLVSSEPSYRGGSRTRTLDFIVSVKRPSRRPGGAGADFIPVRAWNVLADDLKGMSYGDRVLVQGRLRIDKEAGCSVSAHDVWLPDYDEDTHGGREPAAKGVS